MSFQDIEPASSMWEADANAQRVLVSQIDQYSEFYESVQELGEKLVSLYAVCEQFVAERLQTLQIIVSEQSDVVPDEKNSVISGVIDEIVEFDEYTHRMILWYISRGTQLPSPTNTSQTLDRFEDVHQLKLVPAFNTKIDALLAQYNIQPTEIPDKQVLMGQLRKLTTYLHDIRTPLTVIHSSLWMGNESTAQQRRSLEALAVAKHIHESFFIPVSAEALSSEQFLHELRAAIDMFAEQQGIAVVWDFPEIIDATVRVPFRRDIVHRLLQTVFANIRDRTEQDTQIDEHTTQPQVRIRVEFSEDNKVVHIHMVDTYGGFPLTAEQQVSIAQLADGQGLLPYTAELGKTSKKAAKRTGRGLAGQFAAVQETNGEYQLGMWTVINKGSRVGALTRLTIQTSH